MPASERAAGRRLALVVATGTYADPTLSKLRAPGNDATGLAAVLGDATVGGFEVETALDQPAESLRRRIARFCAQVGPADIALMYLSCHGVLDDRGRLYYASSDTDRALLSATAVSSAWLNEQLEDCRSRRQILVLDCCHSGAFAKGAKGEGALALRDRFEGRGRVVLTGSRGTEYSFEHDTVVGDSVSSVFTSALVEGLRSGDADRDGDGVVTVGELYDYVYETVRAKEVRQTPTLWTYGAEGDLLVAHSPRGAIVKPVPLPEDLVGLLESARPRVREGAVTELADLLTGPDPGRALTAREALERVAAEDVPNVAGAARAALEAAPAEAGPSPPWPAAPVPSAPPPPAHPPPPASPPPPSDPPRPPDPAWRSTAPRKRPSKPRYPLRARRRRIAIATGVIAAILVAIAIAIAVSGSDDSGPETISLSGSPRGIAAGGGAWVARYGAGEVTRVDPSGSREDFAANPRPNKIASGEGAAWVSFDEGRKLKRIEHHTYTVKLAPFNAGDAECRCLIAELAIAKGTLWGGSAEAHAIVTFDAKTGEQLKTYELGSGFAGIFAVDEDDEAIWAAETDESEPSLARLIRIDIPSGERETKLSSTGSFFNGVAYGDQRVWIADAGKNVVIAFDPETEKPVRAKVRNGIYNDDIAVAGGSVLVWDPVDGVLTKIDADTGKIVGHPPVPHYRTGSQLNNEWSDLAVGDDFAWVTEPEAHTVHKVEY